MARPRKKTRVDFTLGYGEPVMIIWQDPLYCEELKESELDKEPNILFCSYGEIIRDNDKNLTIASTVAIEKRDKMLRLVTRIPKVLIKSITYLDESQEVK